MLFVFYKLISVLLGLDWHTADILLVFDWYPDGILLMPIHSAGILLSLCLRFPGIRLAWHSVGSVFCFFRNWSNQNAVPELAMFPYRYFAVFRLLNCCFHLVRHVLAGCVAVYRAFHSLRVRTMEHLPTRVLMVRPIYFGFGSAPSFFVDVHP